jgi:adenylylsulfate reductase subunit A
MTQMENRLVVTRFKDGYGPVGAFFLYLKAVATNAAGENYEVTRRDELRARVGAYADAKPLPTCLRNDLMFREIQEGRGPILMHTERVIDTPEKESAAWGAFLNMTVGQAVTWAAQGTDPRKAPVELILSEPYVLGSHAVCAGAWTSGPADVAPSDYTWGYNRMTTIAGLFGAGDTVGGSAHKFSSGSFTEGRLAAKGAIRFLTDHAGRPPVGEGVLDRLKQDVFAPLVRFLEARPKVTAGSVYPGILLPDQGLHRLEKIMDEYGGGVGSNYATNDGLLGRGISQLGELRQDLGSIAAGDLHQLGRAWELDHRLWTAETVLRHTRYRTETRWPGYYYRSDHPKVDDEKWRCFVNSTYDASTGDWSLFTRPVHSIL